MDYRPVKNIVIIGGGSAAWLTAAHLSSKNFNVTVIDKEIGESVGVGEATILGFSQFMNDCGFDFNDWFINCDATFKAGIYYPNWIRENNNVWHPFYLSPNVAENIKQQDAWSHCQDLEFKKFGLSLYDISVNHNKIDTSIIDSYAFHVDAGKLVTYIQSRISNRCKFIRSEVIESVYDQQGNVEFLKLNNDQIVYGDLFIDCTGFRSIINKNNNFKDVYGRLFCNTAIAGRVEYIDKEKEMHPYTKAEAVDHGWVWTTPVQSRMGSGLVFDRNITDVEEAKDFFVRYWDNRITKDQLRVLDWSPKYTQTPWRNNIISIGLSAGFIEPLESTGLALIISQATMLANFISDNTYSNTSIEIYNNQFTENFESSLDFVSSHYSYTEKTGKFWENVKKKYVASKYIKLKKELLGSVGPLGSTNKKSSQIFSGANWTTWLIQLGCPVRPSFSVDEKVAIDSIQKYYNAVETYRHTWSVPHAQEVERIRVYADNYLKR